MPGIARWVATRMSRLATVRSRRVMLFAVCSAAVMLGAIGKSMIDGLSTPNINLDTVMVSDTPSPALPAASAASQPALVPPSATSVTSAAPAASAIRSVPSAAIISHPSTNERSLPDTRRTQPCSLHSRGGACARYAAKRSTHPAHTVHTSHSTHTSPSRYQPAVHAQTFHAPAASASQTEPATWTPAHGGHEGHGKTEKSLKSARENDHH